jgi:hypothetical protein
MPLKRMLEGRNFDPKAVAILVEAFDWIVDELYQRTPAEREKAAKIVIELAAGKASLDAAKLRDEAIDLMRMKSVGVHDLDLDHHRSL